VITINSRQQGKVALALRLTRSLAVLGASLAALLLAACTPEYNWRETVVADGNAQVAFPARIRTEERPLNFDGVQLTFSLTSASVGDAVFAVGYAKLPPHADEAFSRSLVRRTVMSLAASGGAPSDAAFTGEVFELDTQVAGQASRLVARVLVHRDTLIEVVASGPKASLAPEQAEDFMRSLVLR
jgi:hypothetical protein